MNEIYIYINDFPSYEIAVCPKCNTNRTDTR